MAAYCVCLVASLMMFILHMLFNLPCTIWWYLLNVLQLQDEDELDAEDEHRERTRDADDTDDVELDEEEQEVNNHLNELRRQALIESLIGMGFPVEWALRAAEHCDASVSESAAITWIIERMDVEGAGKLDELEGDAR